MKLSVVIINYRTADLTIECLNSFLGEMNIRDTGVVVVDNNSGDDSVEVLRKWLKQHDKNNLVTLVESPTNSGFSGGNNIGIQTVDAECYLLLNSDTIVRKGAFKTLLETALKFPKAGLISPRLEWLDATPQESCFRYPTPVSELIDAAATGPVTRLFKGHVAALEVSDKPVFPQWTSFACVLIKADVIKQVGLLDEGFFMYYEDVEFCYRAQRAGWQIMHNPAARVVHLRGGSSSVKSRARENKRLPRYYYASRSRLYFLLYGRTGLTLANILWWLGASVRLLRDGIERRQPSLPEKKWLDIWTNWRHPDGGKNQVQAQRNKGHP
jgi:GT2 family glycosyltransferase